MHLKPAIFATIWTLGLISVVLLIIHLAIYVPDILAFAAIGLALFALVVFVIAVWTMVYHYIEEEESWKRRYKQ